MIIIKSLHTINDGEDVGGGGEFSYTIVEKCKLVQPLGRTVWRFVEKLKVELPYDTAILLLGVEPEKTQIQKYLNEHQQMTYNWITFLYTWN